jgi:hypothetical protein
LAGDRRRGAHHDVVALASKVRLVVRHEARTLVDQAQRKIRFTHAGWAAEQNAFSPKRNRRAVHSDHAALYLLSPSVKVNQFGGATLRKRYNETTSTNV